MTFVRRIQILEFFSIEIAQNVNFYITNPIHTISLLLAFCQLFIYFFQLRYLQTVTNISSEKNSTILFPVPIDMINSFTK